MSARKIDPEDVEQRYLATGDVTEVVEQTGFRRTSVLKALNARGYKFRRSAIPSAEVRRLYEQGLDDFKIAEHMGRSVNSVQKARNKMKLPVHSAAYRRKAAKVNTKYDYDLGYTLFAQGRTPQQVADVLGCPMDTVYRLRSKMGLSKPHPMKALAPFEERFEQARAMIEEGASFTDTSVTTHVSVTVLRREFPGKQWTRQQAGRHAMDIRYAEKRINEAWQAGSENKLTRPPLSW